MPLSPLLDPDRIALIADPVDRDRVLDDAARLLAGDSPADAAAINRPRAAGGRQRIP